MAATPVAEDAPPSLSRLFLQGWEARRKIDACKLASGSPERAVRERTYRLLLPALLGDLTLQQTDGDVLVKIARVSAWGAH